MPNIHYLICSLIFLIVISWHVLFKKQLKNQHTRFFRAFAAFGVLSLSFGLLSSLMLSGAQKFPLWQLNLVFYGLYVLQLVVPFMFYLYVLLLKETLNWENRRYILLNTIPFFIALLIVLANGITHAIFYFDQTHALHRGPLYLLLYIHAFYYGSISLLNTITAYKQMKGRNLWVIWEIVILAFIAITIQMANHDMLTVGMGIALAITIILLTISNPYGVTDNLTGLFEISGFKETLYEMRRHKKDFQLIVVALDGLKRINHVLGMETGDDILIFLSKKLSKIAGHDRVFRFIGDRFVVLTYGEYDYKETMIQIRELFFEPVIINKMRIDMTASICGFNREIDLKNEDNVIAFMDYVIARAKKCGAGTFLEIDDKIMSDFLRYREIENYLYKAVNEELFEVYYQPIYSLRLGSFVMAEALLRLHHPTLGNISPMEFIPIAERSKQIMEIGRIRLKKICGFLSHNRHILKLFKNIKINLSPAELMNKNLWEETFDMMEQNQLSPSIFQFEITETTATLYNDYIYHIADLLKKSGSGLSLDDFGSGYANLDSVMKLPFDEIKIDRSMLIEIQKNEDAAVLYKNIFRMMSELGFDVVAEGAETIDQVEQLSRWGVDYIQGYYFSIPLPEDELLSLVSNEETQEEICTSSPPSTLLFEIDTLPESARHFIFDINLFDYFRFVNLDTMEVSSFPSFSEEGENRPKCYEIWGRTSHCDNCISKRLKTEEERIVKFEWLDDKVLMVIAVRCSNEGTDYSLELVKDVSKSFGSGFDFYHQISPQLGGVIHKMNSIMSRTKRN